jgi:hypothetical protein
MPSSWVRLADAPGVAGMIAPTRAGNKGGAVDIMINEDNLDRAVRIYGYRCKHSLNITTPTCSSTCA